MTCTNKDCACSMNEETVKETSCEIGNIMFQALYQIIYENAGRMSDEILCGSLSSALSALFLVVEEEQHTHNLKDLFIEFLNNIEIAIIDRENCH